MSTPSSRTARTLRQTLTVARRDFAAIVFTPTFLIFLLAPLIMLSFGAIGGMGAATIADSSAGRVRLVALTEPAAGRRLVEADRALRRITRGDAEPPVLELRAAPADPAAEARRLVLSDTIDVSGVLYGPLDAPTIVSRYRISSSGAYLALLAETALRAERGGFDGPQSRPQRVQVERTSSTRSGQQAAGFAATFVIFFLTLILAGQTIGMLAEERNSKVIEVLAAAVPLEAVFFGKLVGMFGVALLFVGFWGALLTQGLVLLPGSIAEAAAALRPAMGIVPFALIFLAYFTLAFLLLGAVFLGVGAQAGTMREIQMLSLPITIINVAMFGLAAAASSSPGSTVALVAEIFPLSSPYAMVARAASGVELWPHLLAIAWQALWVAIFITIGARLFRRGVLQSGSAGGGRWWWPFGKRSAAA